MIQMNEENKNPITVFIPITTENGKKYCAAIPWNFHNENVVIENDKIIILCTKHGRKDWLGHVGCSSCGEVYSCDDYINMAIGEECTCCGDVLKPVPWALNRKFSGIPACPECYKEQEKKKNEPHEPH
jgi:hypothetical protein